MRSRILGVGAVVAVLAAVGGASAQADVIRVQSTTDTVDAGLVDGLLKGAYFNAQPGDTLDYVGVGTGAALMNARLGLADVVITHAPSLEAQFVADGYSYETLGRAIFYSDYVIIGPKDDPAHVSDLHSHDAISAFEDIAAAGAAGNADFLSRADNSGTNVQEQKMWHQTTIAKQTACNAAGDLTRDEPGPIVGSCPIPTSYPSWYKRQTGGQAANVNRAEACPTATYTSGSCYTMTDRGTFNRLVNAGLITKLKILSDRNTPAARGGQNLLTNPFSAYIVNPAASFPTGAPAPNVAAATRLVNFLTSPSFQNAVDGFPSTSDPAFRQDAFAKITLTPPLPPTATAGSAIAINATLTNRLPGAPAIDGMPVQLQKSTDGGATYTDVGAPVNTSATGDVALHPTIDASTRFRLSMPRFAMLSANTQDLGIVSIPGSPPPPPRAPTDKLGPRLTDLQLTPRRVRLRISEPGSVRITIAKRVRKHRRTTYRTVRTLTIKATRAGRISHTSPRGLSAGKYRVKLRGTDLAGNVRSRTVDPPRLVS